MTGYNSTSQPRASQWWQTVVQNPFAAGKRRNGYRSLPGDATVLLVHDGRVYDTANSRWCSADPEGDPAALAEAAAELLAHHVESVQNDAGRSGTAQYQRGVVLLLPGDAFIATTVTLPGVTPDAVRSALQLQADTLLPGHERDLSLAVNPGRHPDDFNETALWMDRRDLDELFRAFANQGLFLAAVMPRVLAAAADHHAVIVEDHDAAYVNCVYWHNGAVRQWLQIDRQDLEQEAFREQWQEQVDALGVVTGKDSRPGERADIRRITLQHADDYLQSGNALQPLAEYCFFPAGADAVRRKLQQGQRLALAAAAVLLLAVLATLPFLVQGFQGWRLDRALEAERERAADARGNQQVVRDFEAQWGVFIDYPDQDMINVLMALQNVISPNVLSAIEVDEGYIAIEGESADPQSLLEQLEQHTLFTEVDFGRATSNNRYYIEMRLTTADFPAYYEWHFPERQ